MEWYEIIGLVVIYLLGIFIGMKVSEFRKNYHLNGSWKNRKKK
tara:strand:+ start:2067 stop:2195 length:129 start_codon:yes stop_codon:yes gene_type:complete